MEEAARLALATSLDVDPGPWPRSRLRRVGGVEVTVETAVDGGSRWCTEETQGNDIDCLVEGQEAVGFSWF